MSDAFHLTSHDVRAQEFQRVLRGYDPVQVEEFKQRLAEEMDRLVRLQVQLDERLKGITDQLKGFRERERALNEALIGAQQLRADTQVQAGREAEVVVREAENQAEKLRTEARAEVDRMLHQARVEEARLLQVNEGARRQFRTYLAAFRQLLERQLAELSVLAGDGSAAGKPAAEAEAADEEERPLRRPA